ncbi:hypothetical protein RRG08_056314 [Elysia crispata]|uniref:Uncharacterized protein n=1 Tax=Elysia crispata TaxID=231223 RepID=A0AAE1D333_9GAST|nr:hypothetical protein RRG08_056314 [Elysia crispata]
MISIRDFYTASSVETLKVEKASCVRYMHLKPWRKWLREVLENPRQTIWRVQYRDITQVCLSSWRQRASAEHSTHPNSTVCFSKLRGVTGSRSTKTPSSIERCYLTCDSVYLPGLVWRTRLVISTGLSLCFPNKSPVNKSR